MAKNKKTGGRKKGRPNKSTAEVKALIDKAGKKYGGMKMVFERLFELVEGVTVQETDKKGEERIYTKLPDSFAAKILIEQRFGKPKQVIVGDEDQPLITEVKVRIVKSGYSSN